MQATRHASDTKEPREPCIRLGVVGDVHGFFDASDARALGEAAYDRVLFVGDLAAFTHRSGLAAAHRIAPLGDRALVLLGNHDGVSFRQLMAEVKGRTSLARVLGWRMERRVAEVERALGGAPVCGFSRHEFRAGDLAVSLVVGRPHSMGGPRLGYARYMERRYGVRSMEDSARRLASLIDETESGDLVLLAHNGPTGLGPRREDIFGCDFLPEEGDFGDPDLRLAIEHAVRSGRRVRAVVAGHMHHGLQGGGERRTRVERDGILYLNAARVPRIEKGETPRHHHVVLEIGPDRVSAEERWLPGAPS